MLVEPRDKKLKWNFLVDEMGGQRSNIGQSSNWPKFCKKGCCLIILTISV